MSTTYKDAGVDIEAGEAFVRTIMPLAKSTHRPEVLGSLGGFSGLFRLDKTRYEDPLLVAATDGVGTKLKLAFLAKQHDTVGIDLVAMCVNDLVVCGAEPLFFLDYFATGALDQEQGRQVITGIAEGCRQAGCALLGGETAEMPGFYVQGEYDLAGFAVGVVDRPKMLGPSKVLPGDGLLGISSTGVHSNGFSLLRRVFNLGKQRPETDALRDWLSPTRIYVESAQLLTANFDLHALAHITGGGLPGNLPRVLPEHLACHLELDSWTQPEVFTRIAEAGAVPEEEMRRTFNMGIGMVAVLPVGQLAEAQALLEELGIPAWDIGRIQSRDDKDPQFHWPSASA